MPPSKIHAALRYEHLAIIGAGAWGTALALVAASGGAKVTLWAREAEVVRSIKSKQENALFLQGVKLPSAITGTSDIDQAIRAEAILMVPPAQHLRSSLQALRGKVVAQTPILLCAKGIEQGSGLLLTEILSEILPEAEPGVLSGPSFARDVAMGLPTAITIAAKMPVAERLQATLGRTAGFRPYVTDDIIGVALGGAAKNVYAIACGMVEGAGMGESARAALLARGFAELLRLGMALGARSETMMGLSGLGDLVLTATTPSSRNFALGLALGKGASVRKATAAGAPLAEGAETAPALIARAKRHGVELPIAEAVADVLAGQISVEKAAERLLARPFRAE